MSESMGNYAFIDSQNLNLGIKSQGWNWDLRKFRQILRNKYSVTKAYLFIGQVVGNEGLYTLLQESGYILIFKPTLERVENGKPIIKGNVDAELILHAMIQYGNYDKAIIVSGDGDFYCLINYLKDKEKLLKVLAPTRHFSSLLREFNKQNFVIRLDLLRNSLELKRNLKDWHSRSVETLG